MAKEAYLILENGTVFKGKSFGYEKEVTGEVVFTTSMSGYLETITDPSLYGQIITQTFPSLGNYGVISSDFESDRPYIGAYIVKSWCEHPSNFRCEGDIDSYLKENKIPGLYDIDTRRLTKIVREYGVMNGRITYSDEISEKVLEDIKNYKLVNPVSEVTCKEVKVYRAEKEKRKVVLWDLGTKENVIRQLLKRNVSVIRVPAYTKAEEILSYKIDGVVLSGGPGDPNENKDIIEEVKKLCQSKIPMFGISMGHQLLGLANGAKSEKLKYGHRGENQPAKDVETGRIYITCQSHGYALVPESFPENIKVSFENANDGTCEGILFTDMPAFSVEFHPEGAAGPLDTEFLFDKFAKIMEGGAE